jgi:hypothetical protein
VANPKKPSAQALKMADWLIEWKPTITEIALALDRLAEAELERGFGLGLERAVRDIRYHEMLERVYVGYNDVDVRTCLRLASSIAAELDRVPASLAELRAFPPEMRTRTQDKEENNNG